MKIQKLELKLIPKKVSYLLVLCNQKKKKKAKPSVGPVICEIGHCD